MIDVHGLHHAYERPGLPPVEARRDVSLTLSAGEFVALVGANGSGKTTLARHLNALLVPTRGRVRVAGLDTTDRAHWLAIRSQVALVFQRPEDQIVATTVEDDGAFLMHRLRAAGVAFPAVAAETSTIEEAIGILCGKPHEPPAGSTGDLAGKAM